MVRRGTIYPRHCLILHICLHPSSYLWGPDFSKAPTTISYLSSIILPALVILSLQDVFLPYIQSNFSCPEGVKADVRVDHSCLQHVPDLVS